MTPFPISDNDWIQSLDQSQLSQLDSFRKMFFPTEKNDDSELKHDINQTMDLEMNPSDSDLLDDEIQSYTLDSKIPTIEELDEEAARTRMTECDYALLGDGYFDDEDEELDEEDDFAPSAFDDFDQDTYYDS